MGSDPKKFLIPAHNLAIQKALGKKGGSTTVNNAPDPRRNLARAVSNKEEAKPVAGKSLTAAPVASRRARILSNQPKKSTLLGQ